MYILVNPAVPFKQGAKHIIREGSRYNSVHMSTGKTAVVMGSYAIAYQNLYFNVCICSGKAFYEDIYSKVLLLPSKYRDRHIDFNIFTGEYLSNFVFDFKFGVVKVVCDSGYYGYLSFGNWFIPTFKGTSKSLLGLDILLDSWLGEIDILQNTYFRACLDQVSYNCDSGCITAFLKYIVRLQDSDRDLSVLKYDLKVDLYSGVFTFDGEDFQGITMDEIARKRLMRQREWG